MWRRLHVGQLQLCGSLHQLQAPAAAPATTRRLALPAHLPAPAAGPSPRRLTSEHRLDNPPELQPRERRRTGAAGAAGPPLSLPRPHTIHSSSNIGRPPLQQHDGSLQQGLVLLDSDHAQARHRQRWGAVLAVHAGGGGGDPTRALARVAVRFDREEVAAAAVPAGLQVRPGHPDEGEVVDADLRSGVEQGGGSGSGGGGRVGGGQSQRGEEARWAPPHATPA